MIDFNALATKVHTAIAAGKEAANAEPNDGGSANLDCVVLTGLKRVKESDLRAAGIDAWKWRAGEFHLSAPFAGQGMRRYAGVQAMHATLKATGVECHVYYKID